MKNLTDTKIALEWAEANYIKIKNDNYNDRFSKDAAYELVTKAQSQHDTLCENFINN